MNAQPLPKVLVIDDDPVVGRSFDRVLSAKGYAVVTASDGAEALRKMAAEEYDAVFTDIKMPGMDGISVAEQIKRNRPWLPVVIVSGYATAENEARARAAGVSTVLHKPLSPQMIEQSAQEALRARFAETADAAVAAPIAAAEVNEAIAAVAPEPAQAPASTGRAIALAVAAPFLGLAYVLLFPIAGLVAVVGLPVWHSARWLFTRPGRVTTWVRNVALFFAAPFVGLAYIVALPFVGLGALAVVGFRAVFARNA